ncbi:hypothetical protein [Rufibacter sp. LB8]|uniref:hypothetical protein n=1 Tax=Rufibacter sp. LB8 TaxID=2777781 RepID=UPI00178C4D11|nr:hypothetical protein [Rufibacter sp. LB8]
MLNFLRSLFGMEEREGQRTVAGGPTEFGLREVTIIKDSNKRLSQLQQLSQRFQGSKHEHGLQAVYEKTRNIHAYLVSTKKVHELELFHVRQTDHFISAFQAIVQVQEQPASAVKSNAGAATKPARPRVPLLAPTHDMVKPISTQGHQQTPAGVRITVPRLYIPDIAIHTFESVTYYPETKDGQLVPHTISLSSTPREKETFLKHVMGRLGLENVTYVGNTHVTIPNQNGVIPTGMVPVIHWEGYWYALNLNDYRLFPVKISRNG